MKKFELKNSTFGFAKAKIKSAAHSSICCSIWDDVTSSTIRDVRDVIWDSTEPLNNTNIWKLTEFDLQTEFEK